MALRCWTWPSLLLSPCFLEFPDRGDMVPWPLCSSEVPTVRVAGGLRSLAQAGHRGTPGCGTCSAGEVPRQMWGASVRHMLWGRTEETHIYFRVSGRQVRRAVHPWASCRQKPGAVSARVQAPRGQVTGRLRGACPVGHSGPQYVYFQLDPCSRRAGNFYNL